MGMSHRCARGLAGRGMGSRACRSRAGAAMTHAEAQSWIVDVRGERYARWYDDGPPAWPLSDQERSEVESAYRSAFVAAARAIARWTRPDVDAVEDAWRARIK